MKRGNKLHRYGRRWFPVERMDRNMPGLFRECQRVQCEWEENSGGKPELKIRKVRHSYCMKVFKPLEGLWFFP